MSVTVLNREELESLLGRRVRVAPEERLCELCGKAYRVRSQRQRYCSDACRKRAHEQRRRAAEREREAQELARRRDEGERCNRPMRAGRRCGRLAGHTDGVCRSHEAMQRVRERVFERQQQDPVFHARMNRFFRSPLGRPHAYKGGEQ